MSEVGGFALFLGLVALAGLGLWRRWWVPGFWFDEKDAALKAALDANHALREANAELRAQNRELRGDLVRERRRRRDDPAT